MSVALVAAMILVPLGASAQIEPQPHREEVDRQAAETAPEPVLTRAPEVSAYFEPEYPEELREEGLEGEVVLLLTISAEGSVTAVEVVESPDERLSARAMEAAWKLEFVPAEIGHVPAAVQIEFGYVFALDLREQEEQEAEKERGVEAEGGPEDGHPMDGSAPGEEAEQGNGEHASGPNGPGAGEEAGQGEGGHAPDTAVPEPQVTLSGRALVRGLRDPIDGALVISGDQAATTDEDGYFELRLPPGRSHPVEVRAPGFHSFETEERIEEGERSEVVYYVQRQGGSPYETVVRARRPRKEVSRIVLSREETRKVPGTFGDPLRVLENLPGTARAPFIGGQLLVRGSRPEDTGVLFDGVMIPQLYHFGGLTSVVNAEFIDEMNFLPGGFGSEFGRANGGIVDVSSRRLVGQRARGSVKIDLMDTSLFYRTPIGDSLAVGVAVRRSYVDVFLPVFMDTFMSGGGQAGRVTLAPVYSDYQLKLDWSPSRDHDLDLFLFGSRDTLKLLASGSLQVDAFDFDMRLDFHRIMAGHRWRIAPDLVLHTRPFLGMTRQGAGGNQEGADLSAEMDMQLVEMGLRQGLTWRRSDALALRAGLDFYGLRGRGELDVPVPIDLLAFPSPMQPVPENQDFDAEDWAGAFGLWTEAVAEWSRLQVVPGLRLEIYRLPEATRPVLEPRLSARYGLLDGTTLKAAAGLYHKPPTIIEANPIVGNPGLRPESATHLVAGIEHDVTSVIDVDVQLFFNRFTDLVVGGSPEVEDGEASGEIFVNGGDGRAYGAELLLRHKITPRAFGWLAYTLMRSERRSDPEDDYVLTGYDQTHILTLVGSYRLGRGFEIGARFRLASGNPYTPVIGSFHDLDTDRWSPVYGSTRSDRLPLFHQLDLRLEYTKTFDTFTIAAFLDLLNTYNQDNVESYQYDYRYRNRVDFNGLPLFPVLGVRGDW
ncbi:MAG: TonB family protein [Myxococcota bacterium]